MNNLLQVLAWHAALIAAGSATGHHPACWFLFILICLTHQRAMSEWTHEASHFNFMIGRRRLNDFLQNLLIAPIFFKTIATHRAAHFDHHAHRAFFVDNDEETMFYQVSSRRGLLRACLMDLIGLTALRLFLVSRKHRVKSPTWLVLWPFVAHFGIAALLLLNGHWKLYLVYDVLLVSVHIFLMRLRIFFQHVELPPPAGGPVKHTTVPRNLRGNLLIRFLFTSDLMAFHQAHHDKPGIPFRELIAAHQRGDFDCERRAFPVLTGLWKHLP